MTGHTIHARFTPNERRFRYRLLLVDLDIDRLEEAAGTSTLFSIDRPNLFSFKRRDHGDQTDTTLRPWAEKRFADAGVDLEGGPVRLLSFPRHAFYKFAPISVWRGFGPDGMPRGVIYEVRNTFGERHNYVAPIGPSETSTARHDADKRFHVSPFFAVDGRYGFTLRAANPDKFSLMVETRIDEARSHIATMQATARPATTPEFARAAITRPLSSLAVSAAIHWQALWIWRRGGRYHRKPQVPETPATIASPKPNNLVYEK
ncbi:MAG: DUF1365 domain-containing protein [Pseudomonadota bacterium]